MKKHGVFYCKWCGYHCPVKFPVTESQCDTTNLWNEFYDILKVSGLAL